MAASRRIVSALLVLALLVLGAQRPTAFACAAEDPACQDHCAMLASSCATACMVRLLPAPQLVEAPAAVAVAIAFTTELPVLAGVTRTPDTAPPRTFA